MLGSFAVAVKFTLLIAIAFIFFVAATAFATNVLGRAFTTSVVQIGKIMDLNDATKDRAPYLLARAQEIAKPVPLDALYEVKVPPLNSRFGLKDDLKFLEDVKINIQGVDLSFIKNLFAALPDDQPIVTMESEAVATGSAARLEWKEPSGERRNWILRTNTATKPEATKEIIDQAIYKMVYHMYYDPAGPKRPTKGTQFPSSRALEAYYSGQQYLSQYQRERQSTDLDKAEQQFRVLYQEMPNFVDGLMLLGITLLEKKNEREAIVIFKRIVTRPKPAAPAPADLKAFVGAELFYATALRKLYDVEENHKALKEIDEAAKVSKAAYALPAAPDKEKQDEKIARLDFLKIYVSVLAEKAYILGAYLILLNDREVLEALTKGSPPAPAALIGTEPADLEALERTIKAGGKPAETAREQRLQKFRAIAKRIYDAHENIVKEAKELIESVTDDKDPLALKSITSDDAWRRARERFMSDLNNAAGYAQYRYAQLSEDDDDKFKKQCEDALDTLQEAYAVHQTEQTILLNLGLIESDPRCDPKGENIERARKYLEDAKTAKPSDYYAHQLLATLGIRQMYTWGPEFTKPDVVTNAVTAAETARGLRPESGTILAILAQAYTLQWLQPTTSDSDRAALKKKIDASLEQSERRKVKVTAIHLHIAELQWLVAQTARSPETGFDALRTTLQTKLGAAVDDTTGSRSWYGRQLLKDATALQGIVTKLTPKDHASLRWPL